MRKCVSILSLAILVLAGCGGGVSVIYDTISPSATQALDAGQSVTISAKVYNDSSNAGVAWSVNGTGTLSNTTTSSTVYTAPAIITSSSSAAVEAVPVKNSLFVAATQITLSPTPSLAASTLPAGVIGTAYTYQLAAKGGSGTLSYAVTNGVLPAGLTLSSAGIINGTPAVVGASTFSVSVTDQATTPVTATVSFTLNVTAPVLSVTTATLATGVVGTAYSTQLAASGGVMPYIWSVSSGTLPSGLALSATGLLSGVPNSPGVFTFTAQVNDSEGTPQTANRVFTITVYSALTITSSSSLPQGAVKTAYSFTFAASGGTLPYTWSVSSGALPAGLTLSSAGTISGTPTAAGTNTFVVQVADKSNPQQTVSQTCTLSVVLSTLAITTNSLPNGTTTVAYSGTLTSSGGNPPVTWSLAAGSSLPPGLTLLSTGVISGTPSAAGTYSFTVQATDATPATVSSTLSIKVVALQPLAISTTSVPAGNLATAYSMTFVATGGATPYTWSLTSGALPQGLTLSSSGVLSGTPLVPGSYTFMVQVADSQAKPATASGSFTLAVGSTLPAGSGDAMLNGNYAFLLQGFENGSATGAVSGFATIGSLSAKGSGTLAGVEDINTPSGAQLAIAVTGSYTLGSDGRGFMELTAGATTNIYVIAASNLTSGVAQSIGITEFDNAADGSGTANASGYGKLQTATAFLAASVKGTYAFGFSGESPCTSCATGVKLGPLAAVGAFTADGVSAISAGAEDAGAYATNYAGVTFSGTFTTPSSSTGRGTIHVTTAGTLFTAPPVDYTYVVVNAGELLMMSNDSHASTSLLAGDVRGQTVTSYTAASLTGALIGYESQGSGGDGSSTLPQTTNAKLSRLAITGSGTASLAQDSNVAGTLNSTVATAVTYTTSSTGRTAITTNGTSNQVLYPYAANAGFGLDQAPSSGYPGLITYEHQVSTVPTLPPLPAGSYGAYSLSSAAPTTDESGAYVFALSTGGVDSSFNGALTTTLDSSSTGGVLTLGSSASYLFLEDNTGRITLNASGSSSILGVIYAITSTRAASIPASSATAPIVTILQQ